VGQAALQVSSLWAALLPDEDERAALLGPDATAAAALALCAAYALVRLLGAGMACGDLNAALGGSGVGSGGSGGSGGGGGSGNGGGDGNDCNVVGIATAELVAPPSRASARTAAPGAR